VVDFMKRSSVIYTTGEWLRANGEHICRLARYEELEGPARAVEARTDETT
jgi:histidinol dehydrogenase